MREKYPKLWRVLNILKIAIIAILVYFVTNIIAIGLSKLLIFMGISKVDATYSAILLSFFIYALIIILIYSKKEFRKSMQTLHTWTGLVVGWFLYFIFITGTIGYFDVEIDAWMEPKHTFQASKYSDDELIDKALFILNSQASDSKKWHIYLPNNREDRLAISYIKPDKKTKTSLSFNHHDSYVTKVIDPKTMDLFTPRERGGGEILYQMHYTLHYLPRIIAFIFVGIFSMFMLITILNGIIMHAKIFKDYFTFRRDKNIRSWMDFHILSSVVALPFFIMITYTGLLYLAKFYMPLIPKANYEGGLREMSKSMKSSDAIIYQDKKAPLYSISKLNAKAKSISKKPTKSISIINPMDASAVAIVESQSDEVKRGTNNNKTYFHAVDGTLMQKPDSKSYTMNEARKTLLGLHRGLFADGFLRWIFFFSGLLGSAMIATGLILWAKKREFKQKDSFGHKLVVALNKGTVIGLPIAIGAYFIANRLFFNSTIEINTLFAVWFTLVLLSYILRLSWYFLLSLGGAIYLLLPFLSYITTDQWFVFLGFDIFFFVVSALFFSSAYIYKKKV